MDIELIKILNKVQILSTNKEYNYNKMECINSKPALQAGNENLIEYRTLLQLHCMNCKPENIIKKIENYAENREPFDWIYNGKYMGEFVIDSIEKNIEKQIKDVIIYAELTVNLLENQTDKEFKEQIIGNTDLSGFLQYEENSTILKDFENDIKTNITDSITNNIINGIATNNMSETAINFLKMASNKIAKDIKNGKITDIYNTVYDYKNIIQNSTTLSKTDTDNLAEQINSIPEIMLNTCLRSSG